MNKPFRDVFHVKTHQRVRYLAEMVANITKGKYILFYEA